LQNKIGLYLLL